MSAPIRSNSASWSRSWCQAVGRCRASKAVLGVDERLLAAPIGQGADAAERQLAPRIKLPFHRRLAEPVF